MREYVIGVHVRAVSYCQGRGWRTDYLASTLFLSVTIVAGTAPGANATTAAGVERPATRLTVRDGSV